MRLTGDDEQVALITGKSGKVPLIWSGHCQESVDIGLVHGLCKLCNPFLIVLVLHTNFLSALPASFRRFRKQLSSCQSTIDSQPGGWPTSNNSYECRPPPLLFLSRSCVPPSRSCRQLAHVSVLPVDISQRRLIEVLDMLTQEHRVRVVIDWKNGHIGHEDLLCGMQRRHTRLRVGSHHSLCDESIVRLVAPASSVISCPRYQQSQECVGIHVVADPARTQNIIID